MPGKQSNLSSLDRERNRLANTVNRRLRNLLKHPELGGEGTITAIDKQLANVYGKARSPVEGMSWLRAKEHGGGATQAEVDALKRILNWKSSTVAGLKRINREANKSFKRWGYEGPELTPSQISAFFDNIYYAKLEEQLGSDMAVRILTQVMNDPDKLMNVYTFLMKTNEVPPENREKFLQALKTGDYERNRWSRGVVAATDFVPDKRGRLRGRKSAVLKETEAQIFGQMKKRK